MHGVCRHDRSNRRAANDDQLGGLEKDADLSRLRDEYQSEPGVVPASIGLGMVKLRRANVAEGEARANLRSCRIERAYGLATLRRGDAQLSIT